MHAAKNRRNEGADEKSILNDKTKKQHQNNASSETAREINRDIILRAVRRHQPMSRADLARVTGLRPSTVSSIIGQLIEDRWLSRGYRARSARGRRPTNIALDQNNVALAIDLRPEHANLAIIDINGRIIKQDKVAFSASKGSRTEAQKAFGRILAAALSLKKESRKLVFHGVGVAVSGRVDPRTERLVFAPNSLWMHVDLRGEIQRVLGRQVEIDNAANASVISEKWFGECADVPNLIAISVSEGIGTGLLVDGRLLRGEDGLAGEFGHMAFDESGPQCGCGNRGCWEMFASTRAGLRYYRELVPKTQLRNFRELVDFAVKGDSAALQSIDKMIVALGKGLAILSVGLAPDAIIIVGECTALWDRIRPILEQHLAAKSIAAHTPRLVAAMEGDTARLRGAAALVFQKVLFRSVDWT
jgi:predicted NBD/HSP70 family sugar kinase